MSVYDSQLIQKTILQFKENNDEGPVILLFDADNTLFQFSVYGQEPAALRSMYSRNFYKNLPVFTEAPIVIENLQKLGFRCGIVSSAIDSPYCIPEKMQSFQYYFPMISEEDIFILPQGVSKAERMIEVFGSIKRVILVEDYYININDWYEHGGVAIKKSYSGKLRPVPVITSLIDLFYVLRDLNAY